jgi:hypothetical protein
VYLVLSIAGVLIALALAVYRPHICDELFRPAEQFATGFARRKRLVIVTVGGAVILSRIALLRILPIPVPAAHDEFSYLLAGDTFAHGRLANPPHPLWIFLDTLHVLGKPTYASIFPPAQGAVCCPWLPCV